MELNKELAMVAGIAVTSVTVAVAGVMGTNKLIDRYWKDAPVQKKKEVINPKEVIDWVNSSHTDKDYGDKLSTNAVDAISALVYCTYYIADLEDPEQRKTFPILNHINSKTIVTEMSRAMRRVLNKLHEMKTKDDVTLEYISKLVVEYEKKEADTE